MGMNYGDIVRRYYNSSEEPLIGTKKKSFPTQPGDEPVWVQEVININLRDTFFFLLYIIIFKKILFNFKLTILIIEKNNIKIKFRKVIVPN